MSLFHLFSPDPVSPQKKGEPVSTANAVLPKPLKLAKALSRVMDNAFRIPFTQKTIGLDGILGSFPIVGDTLTLVVALYGVGLAVHYQAPTSLLVRMIGNVFLDALVGVVPLLGDVFDVFFKANARNFALLMEYLEQEKPHILYPHLVPPPPAGTTSPSAAAHLVVDVTPSTAHRP
jgi:hypothetical protein